jgi:hypothetical protein
MMTLGSTLVPANGEIDATEFEGRVIIAIEHDAYTVQQAQEYALRILDAAATSEWNAAAATQQARAGEDPQQFVLKVATVRLEQQQAKSRKGH